MQCFNGWGCPCEVCSPAPDEGPSEAEHAEYMAWCDARGLDDADRANWSVWVSRWAPVSAAVGVDDDVPY